MFKNFLPLIASAAFFMPAPSSAAPMTLSVHDADLRSTIMLVAKTGGINVSVDDSVKGKISISLADVEPVNILEVIAKTRNLQIINESGVYIMTADFNYKGFMQSYVFPIKFGDAKTLREAVIMSLDPDARTSFKQGKTTRTIRLSGLDEGEGDSGSVRISTTQTRNDEISSDDDRPTTSSEKLSREERVYINYETNSLILFGTPTEYERVKNLLETLDVELKQVSVEAKILAIDKDATKNLGVEWMWSTVPQYVSYSSAIIDETDSSNVRISGSGESRKFNDDTGYGIVRFGRSPNGRPYEFYYGAKINALVTDGKAKILSRPNVTTIQGREAIINVGNSVPVPKISSTNTSTTTEIDYRDAGIILKYTPRVNADGTITATIHTEVSTPQYVADMGAYRFNTRSADTTVTVRNGEPMIIGGLIGAEEAKSVSKIPFLGDLPILGALFRNHRKSKSESELVIFLTAYVLESNANETVPFEP